MEADWSEDGKQIGLKSGEIIGVVKTCQEFHVSKEDTLEKIQKEFSLRKRRGREVHKRILEVVRLEKAEVRAGNMRCFCLFDLIKVIVCHA